MQLSEADPKGLVRESYNIEGITEAECKSIFIDWALSLKTADSASALRALLDHYAPGREGHPMSVVLQAALAAPPPPSAAAGASGVWQASRSAIYNGRAVVDLISSMLSRAVTL